MILQQGKLLSFIGSYPQHQRRHSVLALRLFQKGPHQRTGRCLEKIPPKAIHLSHFFLFDQFLNRHPSATFHQGRIHPTLNLPLIPIQGRHQPVEQPRRHAHLVCNLTLWQALQASLHNKHLQQNQAQPFLIKCPSRTQSHIDLQAVSVFVLRQGVESPHDTRRQAFFLGMNFQHYRIRRSFRFFRDRRHRSQQGLSLQNDRSAQFRIRSMNHQFGVLRHRPWPEKRRLLSPGQRRETHKKSDHKLHKLTDFPAPKRTAQARNYRESDTDHRNRAFFFTTMPYFTELAYEQAGRNHRL